MRSLLVVSLVLASLPGATWCS